MSVGKDDQRQNGSGRPENTLDDMMLLFRETAYKTGV